jgi:hypothetical protein
MPRKHDHAPGLSQRNRASLGASRRADEASDRRARGGPDWVPTAKAEAGGGARANVSTVDDSPSAKRIVISNRVPRVAAAAIFVILSLSAVNGIFNPVGRSGSPISPGWIFVVVPAWLALRSIVLGIVVDGEVVRLRGWFVTETFRREDVIDVRTVPYTGFWNKGSISSRFYMLSLVVSAPRRRVLPAGRRSPWASRDIRSSSGTTQIDVPAVVAGRDKAERLAKELHAALGLPLPPPSRSPR